MKIFTIISASALIACIASGAALAADVSHTVKTVNGVKVDQYTWIDSQGLNRTVSLKQEGNGNPGHGGYAVQMTYRRPDTNKLITVNADGGDGFGYFVSHERDRDFTDGAEDTIANHIFGKDDSPLGLGIKVTGKSLELDHFTGGHQFITTYPRYGTVKPIKKDPDGNDVRLTPTSKSQLALYKMKITITWFFQTGADYPRIVTAVDLSDVPGPDLVNFDVRGPYGVMIFDDGKDATIDRVIWGDRYHFTTLGKPATRGSRWTWNQNNNGGRYHALIAGEYEMGLFEPQLFKNSALVDYYADERGSTSDDYRNGKGCKYEKQLIPCDWEWPYQSLQYSLPANNSKSTNYKKIAWGSAPYYGTGTSMKRVFDTSETFEKFDGFPAIKKFAYAVCVVLGVTKGNGLTREAAAAGNGNNCAVAPD